MRDRETLQTAPAKPSQGVDLALIFFAWAVARVPLLVYGLPPLVQGDSLGYLGLGHVLAAPQQPAGYHLINALFRPWPLIGLQHLMVLASALLVRATGNLAAGRPAGLAGGLFIAVYPGFTLYAHSFMSETAFNLFLALSLYLLARAVTDKSWRMFFFCGLALGLGSNIRAALQAQWLVASLALLPFYLGTRKAFRQWLVFAGALALGFSLVCLPVCLLVRAHYGAFTLSSGFAKVLTQRLVADSAAPLSRVRTPDPELAAVRDYLVSIQKEKNLFWHGAYQHIEQHILGIEKGSFLQVDPLIIKLWKLSVRQYPLEFLTFSARGLVSGLAAHDRPSALWEFSRQVLHGQPGTRFDFLAGISGPGARALERLDFFYHDMAQAMTGWPVVLGSLLSGLAVTLPARGGRRRLLVCLWAALAYLLLPQFLVADGIARRRYPFDLMLGLFFGIGVSGLLRLPGLALHIRRHRESEA